MSDSSSALGPSTYKTQTRDIDTMLFYCWSTVYNAGPTLIQHWINVSLGIYTKKFPQRW